MCKSNKKIIQIRYKWKKFDTKKLFAVALLAAAENKKWKKGKKRKDRKREKKMINEKWAGEKNPKKTEIFVFFIWT